MRTYIRKKKKEVKLEKKRSTRANIKRHSNRKFRIPTEINLSGKKPTGKKFLKKPI